MGKPRGIRKMAGRSGAVAAIVAWCCPGGDEPWARGLLADRPSAGTVYPILRVG